MWQLLGLLIGIVPIYAFYRFLRADPKRQRYLYLVVAVGFAFFLVLNLYGFATDPGPLYVVVSIVLTLGVVQFVREFFKRRD